MSGIDTSIIILTLNGGAKFPRLLERIYSQRYSGSYEVIVIDSGSTDGTPQAARKYPVRLVEITPEEFHHGRTRNLGAELARGEYLVYITQDALPVDDGWLQKLTGDFIDPQVATVIGRQIPWERAKPPEKFFYYYNFPGFKIVIKSGSGDYYHDNVFISDVNSAYRKEILRNFGFSESIVMAEDKELAIRVLAGGQSIIYEPEAVVYHSHDQTIRESFEKSLDYGLSLRNGVSALPTSSKPLVNRVMNYMCAEAEFLHKSKSWQWLPYSIAYETAKYAGLFLGKAGLVKGPMARRLGQRND